MRFRINLTASLFSDLFTINEQVSIIFAYYQNISLYIPAISYKCLFFCTFKIRLDYANLDISMIFFMNWYKTDLFIFV